MASSNAACLEARNEARRSGSVSVARKVSIRPSASSTRERASAGRPSLRSARASAVSGREDPAGGPEGAGAVDRPGQEPGGFLRLPQGQMRLPQDAQDQGFVGPVVQETGELEGPGQLRKSRRRLAGRETDLAQQAAREHLAPAIGGRTRHGGSPAAGVERLGVSPSRNQA